MTPWIGAALPLLALSNTVLNLVTWPRGRQHVVGGPERAPVSVLIPARNEELTIEAAVRSALAEPVAEVVVCDDRSTDGTAAILAGIDDPRLRVVLGDPLATGWVGKVHACARLAREARSDQLLFLDADTTLQPGALARLHEMRERLGADVVTAFPHQIMATPAERLLLPLLHVTYTSWLPLALIHRLSSPQVLAANGQVLFLSREALEAVGGFASIRAEVVDDMALCRRMKKAGRRVVFAEGSRIAACRMYRSGRELWEGFAKNLYEGLGSIPVLGMATVAYVGAFLVPFALLFMAPVWPELWGPAVLGVGANLLQRVLLSVRFRHPLWSAFLNPVAVVALLALAADSWQRSRRGRIAWKGRQYAARDARGA